MKAIGLLIAGLLLFQVAEAQQVQEKKESKMIVPWATSEWPPYYIPKGPLRGEGRIDRLKQVLLRHAPDLDLVDTHADTPRAVDLWKLDKNICAGAVLMTPERKRWAYFTALSFQVPHEYVIATAKPEILNGHPAISSLKTFLAKKELKGVFTKDRSYGPLIDFLLKGVTNKNPQIEVVKPAEGYLSLLKMVSKKRYDYTIEYEPVVRAYNESILPEKPLSVRRLKEVTPSTVSYFACTKNEWGREIVQKVDGVLQKIASETDYHQAVEAWMEPEVVTHNRKALNEFYKRRARPWNSITSDESP